MNITINQIAIILSLNSTVGFLVGCHSEVSFHQVGSQTGSNLKQKSSSDAYSVPQAPQIGPPETDPGPTITNGFDLTIGTSDTREKKEQVQEIIFILDSSASMLDDIGRLRSGFTTLFDGLRDGDVNFRTRILTMDMFQRQLQSSSGVSTPVGQSLFNAATFNRGTLNSIYSGIQVFDGDAGVIPVTNVIGAVSRSPSLFDNEPGLCTGVDYLTWLKNNPSSASISPSSNIHMVVLSDENNARKIDTFDKNTFQLLASEDLVCYADRREKHQVCTDEKYDRFVTTGKIYAYSYQIPESQFEYSGTYDKRALCFDQGFSSASEAVPLKQITSNKYYATPAYECTRTRRVPLFSFKLGGIPGTSSTSKEGLKSCKTPESYRCEDATSFNICTAGQQGTPLWSKQRVTSPLTSSFCEVAQKFECIQIVDGEALWLPRTRGEALSIIANYGANRCRNPSDWAVSDISSGGVSSPGVRSCSAYVCEEFHESASLNRNSAVAFMEAGGLCVAEDSTIGTRSDFIASSSESYLSDCLPYTDIANISRNVTDTFTQVPAGNRDQYDACLSQPNSYINWAYAHAASTNSSNFGSLNSIDVVAQAPGTVLIEAGGYVIPGANNICPSNIPSNLPVGVSVSDSGNTSPESQLNVNYLIDSKVALDTGSIQSQLSSGGAFSRIVVNGTPMQSTVLSGAFTSYTGADLVFGYQAYPSNHPIRSQVKNFTETIYSYTNELDSGSLVLPHPNNRGSNWTLVEQKQFKADGRYVERSCAPGSHVDRVVRATPKEVQQFLKEEHTLTPITWHSIVFNKNSCQVQNAGASDGTDYDEMTALTKGVSQPICTENFESFFKSLYANVIQQTILKYEFPEAYKDKVPIRVFNQANGVQLMRDVDYFIQGNFLVFDGVSVKKGDRVIVSFY